MTSTTAEESIAKKQAEAEQKEDEEQKKPFAAAAAASSKDDDDGDDQPKQGKPSPSPPPQQQQPSKIYSCQRCRMRLFASFHLVPHDPDENAAGHKHFQKNKFVESGAGKACTSVFLDEGLLEWVKTGVNGGDGESADDKDLLCPNAKCKFKIGSKLWQGTQCSCGAWVTPAFKVLLSRVDVF